MISVIDTADTSRPTGRGRRSVCHQLEQSLFTQREISRNGGAMMRNGRYGYPAIDLARNRFSKPSEEELAAVVVTDRDRRAVAEGMRYRDELERAAELESVW